MRKHKIKENTELYEIEKDSHDEFLKFFLGIRNGIFFSFIFWIPFFYIFLA